MLSHRKINVIFLTLCLMLLVLSWWITVKWWYFLVLLCFRFLFVLVGSSFIQFNYHVKGYCKNPNEKEKKIALTFDDGPTEITPQILALLKKHNIKATFFCIGKNIEQHPEILKQTFGDGHVIGNHSFSHSHFFDFYWKERVIQELNDTNAIIEKTIGKKVSLFRPPYGVTNPSIGRALKITQHKVIGWNIRSMDGVIKNEKIIYNRISKRIAPGSIVLLHDTSETTVRVLEQLLIFLRANEYKIVGIEELLNLKAYEN